MDTFFHLAPSFAALVLLTLGTAALFFPKTMAAFVGLQPVAPIGVSEIRSTLGSFLIGCAATCLWLQSPEAFTVLGTASLTAALVRFVSAVVDGSFTVKNIGGAAIEVLLGVLFFLSWS